MSEPTEDIPFDQAVTQAAWSTVPDHHPIYEYPPTGAQPVITPAGREHAGLKIAGAAAAVMAGAVALAALVPYTGWREPPWGRPAPTPVTATVTTVSVLPAPVTQTETQTATVTETPRSYSSETDDDRYITLLVSTAGFRRTCLTEDLLTHQCSPDPTSMILTGHAQCAYLVAGNSVTAAATHLQRLPENIGRWNALQARNITTSAITAYCPAYAAGA